MILLGSHPSSSISQTEDDESSGDCADGSPLSGGVPGFRAQFDGVKPSSWPLWGRGMDSSGAPEEPGTRVEERSRTNHEAEGWQLWRSTRRD